MLAQILGPYCLIAAVGLFVGEASMKKAYQEFLKSPALLYLGAALALLLGLFIIATHNVWVKNWTVLITLLGWLALIKGTLLMVIPGAVMQKAKEWRLEEKITLKAAIAGLFGVILTYHAYLA